MLRELLTKLVVVFITSSVIINSVFRNTRYDKRQLPVKNINNNTNITDKRDIPTPKPKPNKYKYKPTNI